MMEKRRGRPKGEPTSTKGINLPDTYWEKLREDGIRPTIMKLIEREYEINAIKPDHQ